MPLQDWWRYGCWEKQITKSIILRTRVPQGGISGHNVRAAFNGRSIFVDTPGAPIAAAWLAEMLFEWLKGEPVMSR